MTWHPQVAQTHEGHPQIHTDCISTLSHYYVAHAHTEKGITYSGTFEHTLWEKWLLSLVKEVV